MDVIVYILVVIIIMFMNANISATLLTECRVLTLITKKISRVDI